MDEPPNKKSPDLLHRALHAAEKAFDTGKHAVDRVLDRDRPRRVVTYDGYANDTHAWIGGRALYGRPIDEAMEDDSPLENARRAWKRWETDEIPGAKLQVKFASRLHDVVADEEGYFFLDLELDRPPDPATLWHDAEVTLVDDPQDTEHDNAPANPYDLDDPRRSVAGVVRPPAEATALIVSDVDDTVLHSDITSTWGAFKLAMLNNVFGRTALPGVSALYRALVEGPTPDNERSHNPVFYVSSSAWNIYDVIRRFIEVKELPAGPVLLRDLGIDENKLWKSDHNHKLEKVERLARHYPHLPLVLLGDSGQQDAPLYAEAVERLGADRVKLILIRDVKPDEDDAHHQKVQRAVEQVAAKGVAMHLVPDSVAAAEHCIAAGLFGADRLDAIRQDTEADKHA